jgi:hypothetical protein
VTLHLHLFRTIRFFLSLPIYMYVRWVIQAFKSHWFKNQWRNNLYNIIIFFYLKSEEQRSKEKEKVDYTKPVREPLYTKEKMIEKPKVWLFYLKCLDKSSHLYSGTIENNLSCLAIMIVLTKFCNFVKF